MVAEIQNAELSGRLSDAFQRMRGLEEQLSQQRSAELNLKQEHEAKLTALKADASVQKMLAEEREAELQKTITHLEVQISRALFYASLSN